MSPMPALSCRPLIVGLALVLALAGLGCGGGPVYAALPRTIASAVRADYPGCRHPNGFELERGPATADGARYEIRACGLDAIYVCPRGTRGRDAFCVRERALDTSGGMAPVSSDDTPLVTSASGTLVVEQPTAHVALASPADFAHETTIVRLLDEHDRTSLGLPIATTVAGPLLFVGGLTLGLYEAFQGDYVRPVYCGGTCPPPPPRTVFPDQGREIAGFVGAGVGALLTVIGSVWLGVTQHRRAALMDEIGDECRGIRFGAGPGLVGVGAELCFP